MIEEILSQRQELYGDPVENFRKIGIIWGVLLGLPYSLSPDQVANLFIAAKSVRIAANPDHKDSWFDIQGYATHGLATITLKKEV